MELNFREYYGQNYGGYGDYGQNYNDPHSKYMPPHTSWGLTPVPSAAAGAYLGYALSGGNPLGAAAGGLAGYGVGKLLGPKARQNYDPKSFVYSRNPYTGKVERDLPSQPSDVDLDNMTDDEADRLNADPSHFYMYVQGRDGKWHASRKGTHHWWSGANFNFRPQQQRR